MVQTMNRQGWGYYQQGSDQMIEVEELGSKLAVEINCPVHYPAYGKNLFECSCGVVFPVYLVRSENWPLIRRKHQEERPLSLLHQEMR